MNRQLSTFVIALIAWAIGGHIVAQNNNYFFSQISIKDGLSQSTVKAICRDHKGLLWLGTNKGLNRYDGNEIKQYFTNQIDSTNLDYSNIFFIEEDSLKNLWIGTNNAILLYDRKNDNFISYYNLENASNFRSCTVLEDRVVFNRGDRMITYLYSDRSFRTTYYQGEHKNILNAIRAVKWDQRTLMLGTRWKGVYFCDLITGKVSSIPFIKEEFITDIVRDKSGNIWFSPFNKGLYCYSPKGELLKVYTRINSGLTENSILDICFVDDHQLWLGTDGGGISILDLTTGQWSSIVHRMEMSGSLPSNSIATIYQDRQGGVWIGTNRSGAISVKETSFRSFDNSFPNSTYGLSESTVTSFCEDPKGVLWIGTDGGGINAFMSKDNLFHQFPTTFEQKVVSIANYSAHQLLVSIFRKGLYLFDKLTGSLHEFKHSQQINDSNNRTNVLISMKEISPGRLLIFGESIFLYNVATDRLTNLSTAQSFDFNSNIHCAPSTYRDKIYFYNVNQIGCFDPVSEHLSLVVNEKELSRDQIHTVTFNENRLWIGLNKGCWEYDLKKKILSKSKTKISATVYSLLYVNPNSLWIGVLGKLYQYNPSNGQIQRFDQSDGVNHNEYIARAAFQNQNGELFFGGVMGFQRVNKNVPYQSPKTLKMNVTEVSLNGSRLPIDPDESTQTIVLPPTNNTFIVHLLIQDKDLLKKKQIRYCLEQYNNQPIEQEGTVIRFFNLNAGKYRLLVEYLQSNGMWSDSQCVMNIEVTPYWWKSSWFFLTIIAIICLLIIAYLLLIKERQKNQLKVRLEEHVRLVTEQKVQFLININHELRTPLTLISGPLSRLLNEQSFDPIQMKILKGIHKQTKQMRAVIDMVLDIRRMEVTQETISPKEYNLNNWIENVVEDFQDEYNSHGVKLCCLLDPALTKVQFDQERLTKVLYNLLMNALKNIKAGKTVTVKSSLENDFAQVAVIDQGIGLAHINPQKLFNRFYQASGPKVGSSGIGLSYSKMLIELHNGHMGAFTNEYEGATFFFELPMKASILHSVQQDDTLYGHDDLLHEQPSESTTSDNLSLLQSLTLLIVEDQPELNQFLTQSLTKYFHKIYSAADGIEALDICRKKQPSVVISDVMMPRMDGYEFCQTLRKEIQISHIPLILLTARISDQSRLSGYKAGADGYLSKPFEIEMLLYRIHTILINRGYAKPQATSLTNTNKPHTLPQYNSPLDSIFMEKIQKIIAKELSNEDFNIELIVDQMAMSRSVIYAKMKALTGRGLKELINQERMTKAAELLLSTNDSIADIAFQVGFSNQRYFSTSFKAEFGDTPSNYRTKKDSV